MTPRLLWRNLADEGLASASSEGYGAPAANAQDSRLGVAWTTGTSTAAEWWKVDLGSSQAVQGVALLGHDLLAGDTVLVQGNASDSWGAPSVSEALTWRETAMVKILSAAQTYRWWRISVTKASAGVARSIGRVYLGPAYECPAADARDYRIGVDDTSRTWRTVGGQVWTDHGVALRTLRVGWRLATETFRAELAALAAWGAQGAPFLLCVDAENYPETWTLYGTLADRLEAEFDRWPGSDPLWTLGLKMQEAK